MNKNTHTKIYVTYDLCLKKFLTEHGILDVIYGLHPKTHNMFWVYERNETVNKLLKDWFGK